MNEIKLKSDYITLAQAVKFAGFAQTGGQAKTLVRFGEIKVNGEVVTQPARKLFEGDRFSQDSEVWTITR